MLRLFKYPCAHVLSYLGLGQKLTMLGFLVLSPQWLLAHRYIQLIVDTTDYTSTVIFVGVSSVLTTGLLFTFYYAGKNAQQGKLQPESGEYAPQQQYVRLRLKENHRTLTRIMEATTEVTSAAEELSLMSANSAEEAHKQKSAVDSIASAVEQMVCSINEIEQQAENTREISERANQMAGEGANVVEHAISEIQDAEGAVEKASSQIAALGERSQQVGSIIHVIEDISDQTNLLALNAAIEAARAGEFGRGFSVVADEVRTLANRTHTAASEVAQQINQIQTEINNTVDGMSQVKCLVAEGVNLTRNAGEALDNIKQSALDTAQMINTMGAAVNEQGAVSSDIAHNIEQINIQADNQNNIMDDVAVTSSYLLQLSQRLNQLSTSSS